MRRLLTRAALPQSGAPSDLVPVRSFYFHERQRQRFRDGSLVAEWFARHPDLFDAEDARILRSEHQCRYHFFEALTTVLFWESLGMRSLLEKYSAKAHPGKRKLLQEILPSPMAQWVMDNGDGQPGLFTFVPDGSDWFFCEVKGLTDTVKAKQWDWAGRLRGQLLANGLDPRGRVQIMNIARF